MVNALYAARDEFLKRGEKITDLISGNVNQHGIIFPQKALSDILDHAIGKSQIYQPDPLGQFVARQAISTFYQGEGVVLPPEQILITPGTSISYFYCFKLLAQAGDEILCPCPSYPLFDLIAKICGVQLTPYRLSESEGWAIDLDHLESRLTTRTKAVVLISPHNPTGMVASQEHIDGLAEIATRHELAIIADEVFSPFLFAERTLPRPANTSAPLVFTLNGFSKMFALPGMKLGWIALSGDSEWVRKSRWELELISDTFLPVNEMVQFAVPEIFQIGADFLGHYLNWVTECRNIAVQILSHCQALRFFPPQGGFYLTAEVLGGDVDEDQLVITLLKESKVLVHPGHFYDMPGCHLVTTYVQGHEALRTGLKEITQFLE